MPDAFVIVGKGCENGCPDPDEELRLSELVGPCQPTIDRGGGADRNVSVAAVTVRSTARTRDLILSVEFM